MPSMHDVSTVSQGRQAALPTQSESRQSVTRSQSLSTPSLQLVSYAVHAAQTGSLRQYESTQSIWPLQSSSIRLVQLLSNPARGVQFGTSVASSASIERVPHAAARSHAPISQPCDRIALDMARSPSRLKKNQTNAKTSNVRAT